MLISRIGLAVCALVVSWSAGCATLTKPAQVRIPVVVDQKDAWVEADGQRYRAPAVITLPSPEAEHRITVGAPGHAPLSVTLGPEFRWRTLLTPIGAPIDLINGNAWQVPTRQIEVDLAGARWTNQPDRAAYLSRDDYVSARRYRRAGIGLVVGGMLVNMVGNGFMMSAVCYEECDDGMGRRMTTGIALMGAGTAAVITGAIWWIRNHRRQKRIEDRFLDSHGSWRTAAR
ncbi:MAG TPA: hypothetical protein VML75_24860 [Kofleriaceae bacterium]|nr:hypothetical protein [Kofleriaceae bacterium]